MKSIVAFIVMIVSLVVAVLFSLVDNIFSGSVAEAISLWGGLLSIIVFILIIWEVRFGEGPFFLDELKRFFGGKK